MSRAHCAVTSPRASEPGANDDAERLRELADIAASLHLPRVRDDALATACRVGEGLSYVAVVGQFKRGKSSLINALVGDPILPSGVLPITTVPTIVRFGASRGARVRFSNDGEGEGDGDDAHWRIIAPEQLVDFVSEERNPENGLGVTAVEVFVPSPLLASGMCLVDTPGLGSVFESNAAAVRAFVPHIDAAVVVTGADPPVTGDELDLVAQVATHVRTLIFVLNKADRATAAEREAAVRFARAMIERRIGRPAERLYEVSAIDQLRHDGPERDWPALRRALDELAAAPSGATLVHDAANRAATRIGRQLLRAAAEERDALMRTSDESDDHIRRLEDVARDGERALTDLDALLAAEQARLARRFADERESFLGSALPAAHETLNARIAALHDRFGPALRRSLMRAAQEIARERLAPWLAEQERRAESAFREAMSRFVDLANGVFDRLSDSEMSEMGGLRDLLGADPALDTKSTFVFNEVIHVAEPASPVRFAADVVLGLVAPQPIRRAAHDFVDWLLVMNSSRVQGDIERRTGDARRRLERELRRFLDEIRARARQSAARAREVRAAGGDALNAELRRIEATRRVIAALAPEATGPTAANPSR